MVQRLGLGAFTPGARVQSLVGEIRPHKLRAKKRLKKKKLERSQRNETTLSIEDQRFPFIFFSETMQARREWNKICVFREKETRT